MVSFDCLYLFFYMLFSCLLYVALGCAVLRDTMFSYIRLGHSVQVDTVYFFFLCAVVCCCGAQRKAIYGVGKILYMLYVYWVCIFFVMDNVNSLLTCKFVLL